MFDYFRSSIISIQVYLMSIIIYNASTNLLKDMHYRSLTKKIAYEWTMEIGDFLYIIWCWWNSSLQKNLSLLVCIISQHKTKQQPWHYLECKFSKSWNTNLYITDCTRGQNSFIIISSIRRWITLSIMEYIETSVYKSYFSLHDELQYCLLSSTNILFFRLKIYL